MKNIFNCSILLVCSAGLLTFGAQAQEETELGQSTLAELSRIERPAAPENIPYDYTVDFQINEPGDDAGSAPFTAVLAIKPTLAGDERVTVISQSKEERPEALKELLTKMTSSETSQADLAKEFWCEGKDDSLLQQDVSIEDFTVVSETESEIVVRPNIDKLGDIMMSSDDFSEEGGVDRKMIKKLLDHLDGEFTISKVDAHLKHFRIWMTRPMRVKLIAKIDEMELTQSCEIAPNGVAYKSGTTMHLLVKALGTSVVQNMTVSVRDLKPNSQE